MDLNLWIGDVDGCPQLLYIFNEKDISSKRVIHANTAMDWTSIHRILAQEAIRRLENTSSQKNFVFSP